VEKTLRGKVQKQTFPPSLEIPQKARDSHFPTAPTAADVFLQRPRPKTQTRRKSHYPWTKNGGQVRQYSLLELRAVVRKETGETFVKSYLNTMLRNPFYVGKFVWGGKTYSGTQPRLITNELFERVQDILSGRNKRKCRKHDFAFRGLLTCAEDNCTMTAEVQKGKYIYYRCSGYRGKCSTPYFREEEISQKLGVILKNIQIPDDVVHRIEDSFDHDRESVKAESAAQHERLEKRLLVVRRRMDQAYADKLDGKLPEDFGRARCLSGAQKSNILRSHCTHRAIRMLIECYPPNGFSNSRTRLIFCTLQRNQRNRRSY
jgi:hypothetical protein